MKKLSKQPLIEVFFELHWGNEGSYPLDRNYQLIIGLLYSSIRESFPEFEVLTTANIPQEGIPPQIKIVQYRFWTEGKKWPVVQLGPGILTVNMDKNYESWADFKNNIKYVLERFLEVYPDKEHLFIEKLSLRYIDAFPFDFLSDNVLKYLKEKLHTEVNIDVGDERERLFSWNPIDLSLALEYVLEKPKGFLGIKFFKALVEEKESLILESFVASEDRPQIRPASDVILAWLEDAHEMTDFVFERLIRGELEEELK